MNINTDDIITQDCLKELLSYDSETGKWTWLITKGGILAGSEAGTINHQGYRMITINRKLYKSSRLAFLFMTGSFPSDEVDHINRDKLDDRWVNLRGVSHTINQRNRGIQKNNTSGCPGVSWNSARRKWMSYIKVDGKLVNLGFFETLTEAIHVRKLSEKQHYGE